MKVEESVSSSTYLDYPLGSCIANLYLSFTPLTPPVDHALDTSEPLRAILGGSSETPIL